MKKIVLLLICLLALSPLQAQEKVNKVTEFVNSLNDHFTFSAYGLAGWQYQEQHSPTNEFFINKVVLMCNVKITPRLNAFLMFNAYKSSMLEYWASYRFAPAATVKLGQFKVPFSMENPISPTKLERIDENGLVTRYMIMGLNPLMMPGSGGRDMGITVFGDLFNGKLAYDLAVMNGAGRNCGDINSAKEYMVRLSVNPVKEFTIGVSALLGTGNVAASQRLDGSYYSEAYPEVDGIRSNGDFRRNRFAGGFALTTQPFTLRSEYMLGRDGKNNSQGVYATAAVKNLGVDGLDVVGSFDYLEPAFGSKTTAYYAGVNYWFYPRCRVMAGYEYTKQHGTSRGENSVLTQLQIAF